MTWCCITVNNVSNHKFITIYENETLETAYENETAELSHHTSH